MSDRIRKNDVDSGNWDDDAELQNMKYVWPKKKSKEGVLEMLYGKSGEPHPNHIEQWYDNDGYNNCTRILGALAQTPAGRKHLKSLINVKMMRGSIDRGRGKVPDHANIEECGVTLFDIYDGCNKKEIQCFYGYLKRENFVHNNSKPMWANVLVHAIAKHFGSSSHKRGR